MQGQADPFETLGVSPDSTEDEIRHAYRVLARRWHPDRFPNGPERMWAEQKMAEINEAHRAVLSGEARSRRPAAPGGEREQLAEARRLMEAGQLSQARSALMRMERRSADWNCLFGAVLLRLGETEKALLYFGVAVRQRPEDPRYREALAEAQAAQRSRTRSPARGLFALARRNASR